MHVVSVPACLQDTQAQQAASGRGSRSNEDMDMATIEAGGRGYCMVLQALVLYSGCGRLATRPLLLALEALPPFR